MYLWRQQDIFRYNPTCVSPALMVYSPLIDVKPQPCNTDRTSTSWEQTCSTLRKLWARGGRTVHFAINSRAETDREALQLRTGTPPKPLAGNLGDAVLPIATRMAFNFFLGHPIWRLRNVLSRAKEVAADVKDADTGYLAAVVGGGGLFYPANGFSTQDVSGWQWRVAAQDLEQLQVPLFVFGVGWNAFRNQTFADSPAQAKPKPPSQCIPQHQRILWPEPSFALAFSRSLAAIVRKPNAVIGLRESYSLSQIRAMTSKPDRLTYQPCATALTGAMQPRLASRTLLEPESKVLAINLASDRSALRAGTTDDEVLQAQEVLRFAQGAHRQGWTVHIVQQSLADNKALYERMQAEPSLAVPHTKTLPKGSKINEVFEYYGRNVTVAASMRGHGVMVPFGLHVATISLVTHEKVASFLSDIGHAEWGVEATISARQDRGAGLADELLGVLGYIDRNRARVHAEIMAAQEKLMGVTARNMREFGRMVAAHAAARRLSSRQHHPASRVTGADA